MQARFAGHTRDLYSVAEHCVRVSMACARTDALWGLMHDAAEAYLTDMPKPVKDQLPDYVTAENALLTAVAVAFHLSYQIPQSVHRADRLLLNTEARDLFANTPEWADKVNVQSIRIRPLGNRAAESWFLQRFKDLTRVRIPVAV
jgi:5'-deoxynucleotidase YfbR-like HD superfamily hydrolase